MEYQVLNDLMELNEKRREKFLNEEYFISTISELENPFDGSDEFIRVFIFKNFLEKNGTPTNLIIVVRDRPTGRDDNGFALNNVDCAVFPVPTLTEDKIKLNRLPTPPEIHPDDEKFIIEKRSLPKKPYDPSIAFDPEKHRWSTMQLAEKLHISNRTIGAYCKAHNI